MHPVFIVVPVHNGSTIALDCIRSIAATGHPLNDMVIVDNGSTDGTSEAIRLEFPEIPFVAQANLGYSAAVNAGLGMAIQGGYEYTWILNSDTAVTADALARLEAFMNQPQHCRVGACNPLIYRTDTELDVASVWLNRSSWATSIIRDPALTEPTTVDQRKFRVLDGSALFVRNQAARAVGLFDEEFFMYWEDIDFCVRLSDAGWDLAVVSSARVLHKQYGSSGGSRSSFAFYYYTRNRWLMRRRHVRGWNQSLRTGLAIFGSTLAQLGDSTFPGLAPSRLASIKGLLDGIGGRFGKRDDLEGGVGIRVISLGLWPFTFVLAGLFELWCKSRRV